MWPNPKETMDSIDNNIQNLSYHQGILISWSEVQKIPKFLDKGTWFTEAATGCVL